MSEPFHKLSIADKLRRLSSDLEATVHSNASGTQYSIDGGEVLSVADSLEEIADELGRKR